MTSERTQAYGRVLRTLEDVGPAKLHESEQTRIRLAADELIFAEALDDARATLADVEAAGRGPRGVGPLVRVARRRAVARHPGLRAAHARPLAERDVPAVLRVDPDGVVRARRMRIEPSVAR